MIEEFSLLSEEALAAPVKKLSSLLKSGDWVALDGELGAGKTTFVRHFLHQKGCQDLIVSPTYPLMVDYEVEGQRFIHIDGFRLDGKSSDPWDYREWNDAVLFVEWAEKTQLPKAKFKYQIGIKIVEETKRLMTIFSI